MLLKATNLVKSFAALDKKNNTDTLPVLKGISLELYEKEIVAIVGTSGSGKTTLLNVLGLLDHADSGDIEFLDSPILKNGKSVLSPKKLSEFRNNEISFVFQFHHLLEDFTALENAAFPLFLKTGNLIHSKEVAFSKLERLGLKDRCHHLPSQLSGGERQRVAVARAIINTPKIIFADEPSGNLDSDTSDALYDMIVSISETDNISFLIVTHSDSYAKRAGRVFEMKNGLLA